MIYGCVQSNIQHVSGPHRGSAPGPHWTSSFVPVSKFLATPLTPPVPKTVSQSVIEVGHQPTICDATEIIKIHV